ncbi:hypothetical protein H671_1g2224 [Cricetulus griseus]|uniref:Uncharacterized protein n=1 Tax=Cricetulus griseus TaxID=10029 RepID=A0A061IKZ3_CRIGR|nr:hypothetical protein H671_1g2224 [Cricetulus griseus]
MDVSAQASTEERWVNSIFSPVSKILPVEDIWDKEKEEEEGEEEEEEEEEGEEEENVDKEHEKEEENRIKALLGAPRKDSVWGLMAWPRPSPEQARWHCMKVMHRPMMHTDRNTHTHKTEVNLSNGTVKTFSTSPLSPQQIERKRVTRMNEHEGLETGVKDMHTSLGEDLFGSQPPHQASHNCL